MKKRIRDRYGDDILKEATRRYGIHADNLRLLDGFESFIFEFSKTGREYILRLAHSLRRTPEMIHGEVDWINYLARHETPVARAVESRFFPPLRHASGTHAPTRRYLPSVPGGVAPSSLERVLSARVRENVKQP